jgi:hypothetical protein
LYNGFLVVKTSTRKPFLTIKTTVNDNEQCDTYDFNACKPWVRSIENMNGWKQSKRVNVTSCPAPKTVSARHSRINANQTLVGSRGHRSNALLDIYLDLLLYTVTAQNIKKILRAYSHIRVLRYYRFSWLFFSHVTSAPQPGRGRG